MNRPLAVIAVLLVGLAQPGAVPAQRPSAFAALPLQAPFDPFRLDQLGKLVFYVESSTELSVFSAFTRQWHARTIASGAALRNANDWLLVQEGAALTAFSSLRGTFEPLGVAGAVVLNPTSQRNDSILLVRAGANLHAFSGLQGSWVAAAVSSGAMVAVQRHVAVAAEPTTLFGFSALTGDWVATPIPAPVDEIRADGTVGLAWNDTTLWAFSAQRGTWTSTAMLEGAQFDMDGDVAVFADGQDALGYSGVRGEFVRIPAPAATALTVDQQLAIASDGNTHYAFSAAHAQWTPVLAPGASIQTSAAAAAMVTDEEIHAYSALRDSSAALASEGAFVDVNWTLVAVTDANAGTRHLYSAFTGEWHEAPAGPLVAPRTAFQAALVDTTAGGAAFNARTGRFHEIAVPAGSGIHVDGQSSIVAVSTGDELLVFEPRRDTWLRAPRTGSGVLRVRIWRTSLLAYDDEEAFGYGSQAGEIEAIALPAPVAETRSSSESASLVAGSTLYGFGAVPELAGLWQFPEFRRMYAPGSTLQLQVRAPVGDGAVVVVGLPASNAVMLSIGDFVLAPSSWAVLWSGVANPDGRVVVQIPLPDSPALRGFDLGFQAAVVPAGGAAWLTGLSTLTLP